MEKSKEILFRCDCGHAGFVGFYRDDGFFPKHSVTVEVIDESKWLAYRIKQAIRYIFFGGKLYYKDIILGKKDVERLKKFLNNANK